MREFSVVAAPRRGTRRTFEKHGKNTYALSDYGLTEDQVQEAFAPYTKRFADYI